MRRSFLVVSTAALAGAFVLGCADQPSPTAIADPPTPSFRATVIRGTEPFGFAFDDGRQILFIGLSVEDLTSIFCTGTDFDVDEISGFHLLRPDGSLKEHFKGDETVVVVDGAAFDQSFCQEPSAVPTFTGTARVVLNDNDFFVTGNRANASMLHVTGTVTDESGQLYHLVASSQQVLAPGHPAPDVVVQHSGIKIRLTPIGQ
jgi:hypothetical protein